jgi:hypothetical protein
MPLLLETKNKKQEKSKMQDYKLVVRGIVAGPSVIVDGQVMVQNASDFQSELNSLYLAQGYTIQGQNLLRVIPPDPNGLTYPIYEFAYHLIKEYEGKSAPVEESEKPEKDESKG